MNMQKLERINQGLATHRLEQRVDSQDKKNESLQPDPQQLIGLTFRECMRLQSFVEVNSIYQKKDWG